MKYPSLPFNTIGGINELINAYFKYIEGEYHLEKKPVKKGGEQTEGTEQKVWDKEPEPATLSGLAHFLGFTSMEEFDDYEHTGEFAPAIKRARLKIQAGYEQKLHYQSSTGAIFALKSMGWNEKNDNTDLTNNIPTTIKVTIIESGPQVASNEKDIIL